MTGEKRLIRKALAEKVLMAGDYFKDNHPGGISAVIRYWNDNIEDLNYYPIYRNGGRVTKGWYFLTSYLRMGARMLLDKKIRIIHLHTAADGSFVRNSQLLRLSKSLGRKVILHIHASRFKDFYNESSPKEKEKILRTLSEADRLVVLSNSWKEWFTDIGVQETSISILNNITPHSVMALKPLKAPSDKIHLLFLGEIGKRKGIFDLIKAIAEHRSELTGKIELRIGGNKNEERLVKSIEDSHLENMVFFEGWVSGNKKTELLQWADIFILPSYNEGLPISILEAMSYGCPIISTTVGGIPEIIQENGTLVTPGDIEGIFQAMLKYVDNKGLIQTEGTSSLERVRPYYPESVMTQLSLLYTSLLKE